ncbi:hypothetical protein PENSPDRAFT_653513 [Peniophora sp. CONT]|nr:hypothetical protein PENSPDRAFT_653513 [Peniophora sp. CONT]
MDSIPTEILTEIFRTLTVVDRPRTRPPTTQRDDQYAHELYQQFGVRRKSNMDASWWVKEGKPALGWINVTFVCRRWRECALHTSSLWTYLPDAVVIGSKWLEIFIERGREAGIHYNDKDLIALAIEGHELLSAHIHHIGILRLMGHPHRSNLYHDILQQPMPLVTELSLQDIQSMEVQADLPNLRRLRVWNTTFAGAWPTQLCTPNITSFEYYTGSHLRERGIYSVAMKPVDLSTLFNVLLKMPRLISLTLRLDSVQPNSAHNLPLVELRGLTRMDISGESSNMHPVLKRITFPPSASLRIAPRAAASTDPAVDEGSNHAFISLYENLTRGSGLAPFCTVEVIAKMNTLYFAAARHRLPDVSFAKPSYDLELELPAVQETNMHGLAAKIWGRLCKTDAIRELYVSGAWDSSSIKMFYDLSKVVHVDLMGPAVALLVEYMTGQTEPRTSPEERRIGDHVETLALHRGHLDVDRCKRLAERIGTPSFKSEGRLKTVYLSKANLSLRAGVWEEAGVEVIGV